MKRSSLAIPSERINNSIIFIRDERVMLDSDLASLYEVTTKALNQAVKRNLNRFPGDFMFRLTMDEARAWWHESMSARLRSQNVTLEPTRGQHIKYRPYAFTEHGILMLSSVLKSERAVQVNIEIMRTFVRLRQILASNAELNRKPAELEGKYDHQFTIVFDAIRQLMTPPTSKPNHIGFRPRVLKK